MNYYSSITDKSGVSYFAAKGKDGKLVTIAPDVKLIRVIEDIDTNQVRLAVKFSNSNAPPVEREVSSNKLIADLEGCGYLVPHKVSDSLKEYLAQQRTKCTLTQVYSNIGWHLSDKGVLTFRGYTGKGINAKYDGNLDIEPKGTKEGLIKGMQRIILGNPNLELAMLLGLSSVVVGYLDCFKNINTMVINIYGNSTTGKTTCCNLAVSMCGNPKPINGKQSLSSTWYGTMNGKFAELAGNKGYTVLYDENGMKDAKLDISSFIYGVHSGKERSKANKDGSCAVSRRWATTFISNGEHSMFDEYSTADGLKVRVLNFGNVVWTKNPEQAHKVDCFSRTHCGKPLELLVDHLLTLNPDDVVKRHDELIEKLIPDILTEARYKERVATMVATLLLTGELFQECLGIELNLGEIKRILLRAVEENTPDAEAKKAYEYILQCFQRNRNKFACKKGKETISTSLSLPPKRFGVVTYKILKDNGVDKEEIIDSIWIMDSVFAEWMKDGHYSNVDNILREWRDKYNWLKVRDNTRLRMSCKIEDGGVPQKCVVIKLPSISISEIKEDSKEESATIKSFLEAQLNYCLKTSDYSLDKQQLIKTAFEEVLNNGLEQMLNRYCAMTIDFDKMIFASPKARLLEIAQALDEDDEEKTEENLQ